MGDTAKLDAVRISEEEKTEGMEGSNGDGEDTRNGVEVRAG